MSFNRFKFLFFIYALFCVWTPVFWWIHRSREIYKMEVMDYSRLPWTALLFGLIICCASLGSQFLLIQMVEKSDELDRLKDEANKG